VLLRGNLTQRVVTYKDQSKIQQEVKMMENQQMSAGAMIGLAIILGALIWLLPGLVLWIAWFAVILLFIGGLLALFTR